MASADGIVSQKLGVGTADEEAKAVDADALEFKRARQRGYQATYRQRLKKEIQELTRRNEDANQKLSAARGRLAKLQNTKIQLQERLHSQNVKKSAASPSAGSVSAGSECNEGSPAHAGDANRIVPPSSLSNSDGAHVVSLEDEDSSTAEVGKAHPFQQMARSGRHRPSPIWSASEADPMKGTPMEPIKVPVSFANVAACAPRDANTSAADNCFDHAWFLVALETYMHEAAAKLQCRVQDIRWTTSSPFELLSGDLLTVHGPTDSFSAGLTFNLGHMGAVIESLMLEAEHQFLELSTGVQSKLVSGPLLQELRRDAAQAGRVDICSAPDPILLQCLQVFTDMGSTKPLAEAVRCVMHHTLHCKRTVLPTDIWKAVCLRVVRWLQGAVNRMQKATPDAEKTLAAGLVAVQKEGKSPSKETPADLPLSDIPSGNLIVMRAMLAETITIMKEGPVQAGAPQGRGLAEVRYRMLEILGFHELVRYTIIYSDPRKAFRLITMLYNDGKKFPVKVERKLVNLIRQFDIQDDQAQYAAKRWYRWCRRRTSLSKRLATAATAFDELCPNLEDVRLRLLSAGVQELHTPDVDNATPEDPAKGSAAPACEAQVADAAPKRRAPPKRTAQDESGLKSAVDVTAVQSFEGSTPSQDSGSDDETVDSEQFMQNMFKAKQLKQSMADVDSSQQLEREAEKPHSLLEGELNRSCSTSPGKYGLVQRTATLENRPIVLQNYRGQDATRIIPLRVAGTTLDTIHECEPVVNIPPPRQGALAQDKRSQHALLLQLVEAASERFRGAHGSPEKETVLEQHSVATQCSQHINSQPDAPAPAPAVRGWSSSSQPGAVSTAKQTQHSTTLGADLATETTTPAMELQRRRESKLLLGECGESMRDIENAVMGLISYSHSDFLLIWESTCFMMGLTPVQHSRKSSEYMRGAPKFDILKLQEVAAHEQRWKDMFAPFRIFEHPMHATES